MPSKTSPADILARNLSDDSNVLIENQLESTDHRHLGQILTYLPGLEAKTVVWIATRFREPHLSAVKWLNEHTPEDFNFFAVRLRVVRIAESPGAPILDVLVRPNSWERRLQAAARNPQETSELAKFRKDFWTDYLERFPGDKPLGVAITGASSNWLPVDPEGTVNVSLWLGKTKIGAFVRGARGSDSSELADLLDPIREHLEEKLQAGFWPDPEGYLLKRSAKFEMTNRANWPAAIDWLHETAMNYLNALKQALPEAV